ncbi:Cof-type HAD-IIB family hydrolase [Streptococcus ovis]|uniref:Cof-type HAD-IIB family hydrolase n=1 Tax=Streptococcus ovis TaxID=82806 RepID=UPI00036883DB|nr:Cof-type HAD-IIB family hydrolase [Streptococcus ovis]
MIKLLALDMDGTLLNDQKQLTQAQIDAIHAAIEAGIKLVLCTGRILQGTKPYFEQLGLNAENEYVIVNNGCSTHQTKDWKLIDWEELSVEDITYLAPFAQNSQMQFTLFDEEHYFVLDEEANEQVLEDTKLVFIEPTILSYEEAISGKNTLFQAMFVGNIEATDRFQEQNHEQLSQRFNAVRSQPIIYEVLPKHASKASALKKLAERLNILPNEIMAIGDANNDIEMLKFAGLSIAMGNAADHIKALTTDVTEDNNHDGVAKAIEKWILKK